MGFYTLAVGKLFLTLNMPDTVFSNSFRCFFPEPRVISSWQCAGQYCAKYIKDPCGDLWISISAKFWSLVLELPLCLRALSLVSVTQESSVGSFVLLFILNPGNSLNEASRSNNKVTLFVSILSVILLLHCLVS